MVDPVKGSGIGDDMVNGIQSPFVDVGKRRASRAYR
jgi:hypothetical protein